MKYLTQNYNLRNQVAIVTGGTRGMGREISLGLAAHGSDVVVLSRNISECEKVVEEIHQKGGQGLPYELDITSPFQEIEQMIQKVLAKFNKIDILVNNAGGFQVRKPLIEIREKDWDKEVTINLKGLFFISKAVAKVMMGQGMGKIVNISSMLSSIAVPNVGIYSVCKAGVSQLTRAMAVEWAQYNINVNAICPGWMETNPNANWVQDTSRYKKIVENTPLKRAGRAIDVVGAALLLSSNAADFITGEEIRVDGGWTII